MQWQAVREVFVAALEIDPDERDAFIARETTDPDVAAEVKRLLRLHGAAGGFLETAAERGDVEHECLLSTGELIAERFEVLRLLGRGGMAEVYEARDQILGEHVALKVMRPRSGDPAAQTEQFRQEVQLARRISHPGVCRVHDVALHRRPDGQPLLVITMELLAGETLAERLRHNALSKDQARAIATEIAVALDTAHAHGILHGDIKPENVILVPRHNGSSRAVLTDFGLAKGLGGRGQPAVTSALMGTPAYMAPELFRGATPSIASDVYAFALLTYRLLSTSDDVWRTTRVLAVGSGATLSPPAGLNELDPNSRQVLSKALSADPAGRFGSATDVVRALFPQTAHRSRRLPIMIVVGVAAVVLTLTVVPFVRWGRDSQDRAVAAGAPSLLLLTATDNRTGESELDGMTELLRGQLAQSARFDLIAPDTVPRVLKEMRQDAATLPDALKLREVALRQGATLVLYSAVSLVGTAYRLDVRLEHVGARPSIVEGSWDQTFQAPDRSQLLDVVRRATIWVRSTAGESKAQLSDQDRLPSEITTGSWEGLRAFAKAQQAHQHGDLPNAVVYLQEAVRLDPEFVSAYARLGDVLISLRREPEGYAAWQRAVEIANGRQLTTRETLRLRGQFLEATGSLHETEEAFRAYVLHYPADFDANIYLGSVIAQQGRTEEAVPWLERATRLRPSAPSGHVFLATRLIELQRLDEAVAVAEALRQSTEPEWATWVSALMAFARGNLERAVAQLEEVRGTTNRLWQSRIYTLHSSWLAEAGRFADAEQELVQGIAFDAANGLRDRAALKWIHVAALRARVNDRVASADALKKAITVSDDARTLALAGSLFAQLGMPDELRQVRDALARQPGISRARRALQRVDAELWRMRGRADLAIQTLDEGASEMPFTETRDFHVRALMAAGREADAVAILADWVRHPARFYAGPEPGSPGPWAAAVDEYRVLLQRQGNDREAAEWTGRLAAFRHEQPTTLKRRIRGGDIGKTK